jgi:predicted esterase
MRLRKLGSLPVAVLLFWAAASGLAGWLLSRHLVQAPVPHRTEPQRAALRAALADPGDRWTRHDLKGGQGAALELWWLHRPAPRGLAVILHGFGDDAWGAAPWARSLPGWDIAVFTFRGRDRHPEVPATLGAHERADVASVVRFAEAQGVSRARMILVGSSQGAGVALLALADLDPEGPLGGALLECPFRTLREAARNHVKGVLGAWEPVSRPAQWVALHRAGALAAFDPDAVSPQRAAQHLRTPVALLTGDADPVTPVAGVRAIAHALPDLTVVPGAGHCEAAVRVPGGWQAWAAVRLARWNLTGP